jgi:hypothetical protein
MPPRPQETSQGQEFTQLLRCHYLEGGQKNPGSIDIWQCLKWLAMDPKRHMTKRLFIIGNGFDLHHGIDSGYWDFASYLKEVAPETFRIAEDYVVPEKKLWSSLEEQLAYVDIDQIEDYASNFLMSYGDEDWSESGHHDYEYEIKQVCDAISRDLRKHFADWVRQLDIPDASAASVRCVDPNALFLNFNYTPTLQRVYGVPSSRVLHIHGSAADPTSEIILGHGWQRQEKDLRSRHIHEDTDVRVAGGFRLIDDLLAETFKPTNEILLRNKPFFAQLGSFDEVFVFGHSMSQVDEGYFHEVLNHVAGNARWTVSFYGNESEIKAGAEDLGIPSSQLTLSELRNL